MNKESIRPYGQMLSKKQKPNKVSQNAHPLVRNTNQRFRPNPRSIRLRSARPMGSCFTFFRSMSRCSSVSMSATSFRLFPARMANKSFSGPAIVLLVFIRFVFRFDEGCRSQHQSQHQYQPEADVTASPLCYRCVMITEDFHPLQLEPSDLRCRWFTTLPCHNW